MKMATKKRKTTAPARRRARPMQAATRKRATARRRRMNGVAGSADGKSNVMTMFGVVGGIVLAAQLSQQEQVQKMLPSVKNRAVVGILLGAVGAYYTKRGLLSGVAIGIGAASGALVVMDAMNKSASTAASASTTSEAAQRRQMNGFTLAQRRELMERVHAAGVNYPTMNNGTPRTLNRSTAPVLNSSFDGQVGW